MAYKYSRLVIVVKLPEEVYDGWKKFRPVRDSNPWPVRYRDLQESQNNYIHTYIHTYKQTNKQTNKHTYIHTYIHTDRQTQTDRQTDWLTDRQTDRQTIYLNKVMIRAAFADVDLLIHAKIFKKREPINIILKVFIKYKI